MAPFPSLQITPFIIIARYFLYEIIAAIIIVVFTLYAWLFGAYMSIVYMKHPHEVVTVESILDFWIII